MIFVFLSVCYLSFFTHTFSEFSNELPNQLDHVCSNEELSNTFCNDSKPRNRYGVIKINNFCLSHDCSINIKRDTISVPSFSCFNSSYHLFHDIFINNGKIVLISLTPYVLLRALCQMNNYCNQNKMCMSLPKINGDVIKVNKNFNWKSILEFRILSTSRVDGKSSTKSTKLKAGRITYDVTDIAEPVAVTVLSHSIIKKELMENNNSITFEIRLLNCVYKSNEVSSQKYLIERQYQLIEQIINDKILTMFTLFSQKETASEVKTWLEYYRYYHGVQRFILFYNLKGNEEPHMLHELLENVANQLDWINEDTLMISIWPYTYRSIKFCYINNTILLIIVYVEGIYNDVNRGGVCFHNAQVI